MNTPQRTLNTLAREGINPSKTSMLVGSKFGQPGVKKGSDQQKILEQIGERRSRKEVDSKNAAVDFLPRDEWVSLSDGWFQTTSATSGTSARAGLHSLIEGSPQQAFLCAYEPRSREVFLACTSRNPEYDLEVSTKLILSRLPTSRPDPTSSFHIVFAFRGPLSYMSLSCEIHQRCWVVNSIQDGVETALAEVADPDIKPNVFYNILIQVRSGSLSIDINTVPVFTSLRVSDSEGLSGILGLMAKSCKFAVKGWKVRAPTGSIRLRPPSALPVPPSPVRESLASGIIMGKYSQDDGQFSGIFPPAAPQDFSGQDDGFVDDSSTEIMDIPKSAASSRPSSAIMSLAQVLSQSSSSSNITASTDGRSGSSVSARGTIPLRRPVSATLRPSSAVISPPHSARSEYFSKAHVPRPTSGRPGQLGLSGVGISSGSSVASRSRATPKPTEGSWLQDESERHGHSRLGSDLVSIGGGGPGSVSAKRLSESRGNDNLERMLMECSQLLLERHEPAVVDMVIRDVVQSSRSVSFDDIAALNTAKRLLHEAVMLPLLMPEFFTGIREPWKGVLLFGPPGTGKTLLAKAVCGFNGSTFFSCSSSSLISKFRGESEKIVRCLFEAARICAPAVVFLDEVDALVSARGADGEHEASRRLKTEFFAQMDGVTTSGGGVGQGVMVLATTNCPWDLDEAMRRRLEKRIHIPLPGVEARKELFKICLRDLPVSTDVTIDVLSTMTEGYSGADIHIACREASMMPMRRLISMIDPTEIQALRSTGQLLIPKVIMEDFVEAIANTRPSVSMAMVEKFYAWEREFGSY